MKQTIIHDRFVTNDKIRGQLRGSIQYHRDREQNLIRHKKYKVNSGASRHRSIYSLAMESNIIINDLDFNPPKLPQSVQHQGQNEQKAIHYERKSRESSSVCISKDIKLQRYSRQDSKEKRVELINDDFESQKHNRQKISLLKRIIEHYNIKSFQSNYYSNLMNNLGIKVSGGTELKNRFTNVKTNSIKFQKEESKAIKHERSLKVKHNSNVNTFDCDEFFNNSMMKVEAQSINHLIKYDSQGRSISKKDFNEVREKDEKIKTTKNLRKANHSIFKATKKEMFRHENLTSLKFYDNGQNCVNIKVNKYKEFLYLINFSNNIYRQLDIEKYENPFKIYIGPGNNSNLIRAIVKKRFWFEITKNKEEAHFIWTQLKDEEIFKRQVVRHEEKVNTIQIIEKNHYKAKSNLHCRAIIKLEPEVQEQTAETFGLQNSQDSERSPENKRQEKNEQTSKQEHKTLKVNSKNLQTFNPYSKVLTNENYSKYIEIMNEITSRRKSKFSDRMKYTKNMKYASEEQLNFEIIQNHLPLNGLLGNKKAMFYIMKEYCRLNKKNLFDIVPLTFHIKKGLMDEQFKHFMEKFNENKASKKPNYWIMKPGEFSNRGQGISCTSKAQEVRAKINNLKKIGKTKSLILQQYMINPLLYNGRKFDIRTYMLVSINNGKLRAYWYQDGYIRTSSYMWRLDEINDNYIHLTNDAIQKYTNDYGKYEPANKLTYSELQRYLDTLPKTATTKYNFQGQIYPKLKEIATDAVKASFQFLHPDRRVNNFQIYGFDFMIDNNFKPWLIEINTNPCLEVNCLVLERIIPGLIQNAFRIGLDPIFPPPMNYSSTYKYNIPENALHYNRFQLIFDEQRDGSRLLQLYRDSKVVQSIDDYEEDKEIYEQQGEEINLEQN